MTIPSADGGHPPVRIPRLRTTRRARLPAPARDRRSTAGTGHAGAFPAGAPVHHVALGLLGQFAAFALALAHLPGAPRADDVLLLADLLVELGIVERGMDLGVGGRQFGALIGPEFGERLLAIEEAVDRALRPGDLGQVRGVPYVAYDYISGKTLAQVLEQSAKKHSPVPLDHALLMTERGIASCMQGALGLYPDPARRMFGLPGAVWTAVADALR